MHISGGLLNYLVAFLNSQDKDFTKEEVNIQFNLDWSNCWKATDRDGCEIISNITGRTYGKIQWREEKNGRRLTWFHEK